MAANFGKTDISVRDLRIETDSSRAIDILSEKGVSNPGQKLELYLTDLCNKVQRLPDEGCDFPWRSEESIYRIYITEILLQRTHGTSVQKVYSDFFESFSTPSELYNAEEGKIKNKIESLGFQNKRAKCLNATGDMLMDNGYKVPKDRKKLEEPWRVGKYVANATLLFGFGQSVELVDSNIASAAESLLKYPHESAPHEDDEFRALMAALTPSSPRIARAFYFALIDFEFKTANKLVE
jgi:A/G-specific DNA glycosylase